jgi:tRNA(fMet)-specific endonuclease VapC
MTMIISENHFGLSIVVCIRLLKGSSASIQKKIENISVADIIIPAMVRFELYYGAFKSQQQIKTLRNLNNFLKTFDTIELDNHIAELAGKISAELEPQGTPIGPFDLLIGASALARNGVLITHNTSEFSRIAGLMLEDWEE